MFERQFRNICNCLAVLSANPDKSVLYLLVRWEQIESRRETPRRLSICYVLKCFPLPAGKKQINSEDNWPINAKLRRNFPENSTDRIVILCRKSCPQRLQDQEQYNRVHSDARPNVRNKSGCPDEPRLTVSVLRERR